MQLHPVSRLASLAVLLGCVQSWMRQVARRACLCPTKHMEHGQTVGCAHSTVRYWDLRYFFDPRTPETELRQSSLNNGHRSSWSSLGIAISWNCHLNQHCATIFIRHNPSRKSFQISYWCYVFISLIIPPPSNEFIRNRTLMFFSEAPVRHTIISTMLTDYQRNTRFYLVSRPCFKYVSR